MEGLIEQFALIIATYKLGEQAPVEIFLPTDANQSYSTDSIQYFARPDR